MFEKWFRLKEAGTDVRTEVLAGVTTFLTMAYIIFVQPAVLSGQMFGMDTGMNFNAVMAATCLSAAIATAIMALHARYPVALAPGMGENFVFIFSVIPAAAGLQAVADGRTTPWQVAMGVVLVAGMLFFALSLLGVREALVKALSPSMKNAIAVGIGLFIAFIGLQNAGIVLKSPSTGVKLNPNFLSPDLIVFFFGLLLTVVLHVRRVRGAILWGILGGTVLAVALKLGLPAGIAAESKLVKQFSITTQLVAKPPSLAPTFFKADIRAALTGAMLPFVVIFLFMDIFDTIGTLVGVGEQAGLMKDNELPRARQAMLADAAGTVVGGCLGTSTVTSFIESAAGVEQGGRTGLTSLTVAVLFLLALFFSPLVGMVGSYPPITAPALVIVGSMMVRNVLKIDWDDASESIPAFLVLIGIPFFYSIADGLALGFIAYPIAKVLGGKARDVKWLTCLMAAVLLAYFVFVRPKAG